MSGQTGGIAGHLAQRTGIGLHKLVLVFKPPRDAAVVIKEFAARFDGRRARFVRVLARSLGTVPDWHYGAGGKVWLQTWYQLVPGLRLIRH